MLIIAAQSNKMFETFWRWSSGSSMCNEVWKKHIQWNVATHAYMFMVDQAIWLLCWALHCCDWWSMLQFIAKPRGFMNTLHLYLLNMTVFTVYINAHCCFIYLLMFIYVYNTLASSHCAFMLQSQQKVRKPNYCGNSSSFDVWYCSSYHTVLSCLSKHKSTKAQETLCRQSIQVFVEYGNILFTASVWYQVMLQCWWCFDGGHCTCLCVTGRSKWWFTFR